MDEDMDKDGMMEEGEMDADEPEGDDSNPAYAVFAAGQGLVFLGAFVNYLLL